jgi:hypothetical protein
LLQVNTPQVHRYWQDCVQQFGGLFKVRILHMRLVVVSDPLLVQTVISRGSDLPKASQVYDTVDEVNVCMGSVSVQCAELRRDCASATAALALINGTGFGNLLAPLLTLLLLLC